jgi:hypothetical protein
VGGATFPAINAPTAGGLAGGAAHPQSRQASLAAPASTALADAPGRVEIVALMALANLRDLPPLLFTLLLLSIATDFQVVAFPTLHTRMGPATTPLECVFAFCTAGIIAATQCIGWTDTLSTHRFYGRFAQASSKMVSIGPCTPRSRSMTAIAQSKYS